MYKKYYLLYAFLLLPSICLNGMEDEEMKFYPPLHSLRESEIDEASAQEICSVIFILNTQKAPLSLIKAINPIVFNKLNNLKFEGDTLQKKTYKKLVKYVSSTDVNRFNLIDKLSEKEYAFDVLNDLVCDAIEQAIKERDTKIEETKRESSDKLHPRSVAIITGSFSLLSILITAVFTWFATK